MTFRWGPFGKQCWLLMERWWCVFFGGFVTVVPRVAQRLRVAWALGWYWSALVRRGVVNFELFKSNLQGVAEEDRRRARTSSSVTILQVR